MKKYLVACLLIIGVAGPAFAAPPAKHFAVKDTVGNCSVVEERFADPWQQEGVRFGEGCPGRSWLGLQVQNRQRLTRLGMRRAGSQPASASR